MRAAYAGEKMKTSVAKIRSKNVASATVAVLRSGGIVIIPTESAYGIAADATNTAAVVKVYRLKKRSKAKFMPIIVASMAMAKKYVSLNRAALNFCKFFPAPLTLVVRQKGKKLATNISTNRSVAFRVPAHKFCREVSHLFGKPVTSTSANISGKAAVFSVNEVKKLFRGKVDLIIDAGNLKKRKPSTIVNCTSKKPVVLRKGAFKL